MEETNKPRKKERKKERQKYITKKYVYQTFVPILLK
jgi:hypothetical protein